MQVIFTVVTAKKQHPYTTMPYAVAPQCSAPSLEFFSDGGVSDNLLFFTKKGSPLFIGPSLYLYVLVVYPCEIIPALPLQKT